MQMGKDTIAEYIMEYFSKNHDMCVEKHSFAKKLKSILCDVFEMDTEELDDKKISGEIHRNMKITVRESLQLVGETFRSIDPNIWIRLCMRDRPENCIITDVRYENEMNAIKDHGGILIILCRSSKVTDSQHPSEVFMKAPIVWFKENTVDAFSNIKLMENVPQEYKQFDYFIRNDSSLKELKKICDNVCNDICNTTMHQG